MSQHPKRVVILFSLLVSISLLSINSYGQGGAAERTSKPAKLPATNTKSSKTSKPTKRRVARANRSNDSNVNNVNSDQRSEEANSKAVEISFWDSVKNSINPEDFRAYLAKYPDGEFAQLARNRIYSLDREAASKVPTSTTSSNNRQFYFSQLTITIAHSPYRRDDAERVAQRLRGHFANVKLVQYTDASLDKKLFYRAYDANGSNLSYARQIAESVSDIITLTPSSDGSINQDFEFRIWIY